MNTQETNQIDYRRAYEEEHKKCTELFRTIADLEAENEDLKFDIVFLDPPYAAEQLPVVLPAVVSPHTSWTLKLTMTTSPLWAV